MFHPHGHRQRNSPERKHKTNKDGSYKWLHPTKGWRRVCAARARLNW